MAIQLIVAGLGPRGRDWVREVNASGRFRLVACVDADESVLRDAAAQLKIPETECFTNLDAAMTQTACQAVIVATPPALNGISRNLLQSHAKNVFTAAIGL